MTRCPGCSATWDRPASRPIPGHKVRKEQDGPRCPWSNEYAPGYSPGKPIQEKQRPKLGGRGAPHEAKGGLLFRAPEPLAWIVRRWDREGLPGF